MNAYTQTKLNILEKILKRKLKSTYMRQVGILDSMSCGHELALTISNDYFIADREVNKLWSRIKAIHRLRKIHDKSV